MSSTRQRLLTDDEFEAVVATEDPLRLVIAAHNALDCALDALMAEVLPDPDMLELRRLSFSTKVDLLMAMQVLWAEPRPAWRDFNKLRNEFAHGAAFELTPERVAQLRGCVPPAIYRPPQIDAPLEIVRVVATVLWVQATLQLGRVRDRAAEWRHVNARLRRMFVKHPREAPSHDKSADAGAGSEARRHPDLIEAVERDRAERHRRGEH